MRVSVVIPLYNGGGTLGHTLASVLAQTHADFEVIVVDDGSTDGGGEIVRRCHDPRVRLASQANRGVSAARNRGIEEATSDWVAFLDADDEWHPAFLERTVGLARAFPEVSAIFANYAMSGTEKNVHRVVPSCAGLLDNYFSFCLANTGEGMHSSSVLARRTALQAVGGFPVGVTHFEDVDTWWRLAWTGPVGYIPEALAVYHTETLGSATKQVTQGWSRPPLCVETYRRWRREGRVPARLVSPGARLTNLYLMDYVYRRINAGDLAGARRFLRAECSPWRASAKQYARLSLLCWTPPALREWHRRQRRDEAA